MKGTGRRSLESGALNESTNTGLLRDSSGVTQGTERTDARFSSMRSRALSSLLSSSTAAAFTPLELATARGPWALFCFRVRNARLSRALLILSSLLDCLGAALEATNMASAALIWASHLPVFVGLSCVVITGAGARGLWSAKQAYLRSWSGWMDFLCFLNILADLMYRFGVDMGWWSYTATALAVFAVLRNLRSWAVLRMCHTFRSAISQLARSANDLAAVCMFVLVFSVLVLIVLLHFYGFTCWNRCYPDLPLPAEVQASDSCSVDSFFWDLDESQPRFCSDHRSPCNEGTQCRNLFLYSVTSSCSDEERRRLQEKAWVELQTNEEAGYGVLGFQTLGAAAVTLLQGYTLEGWAITMQRLVDGDNRSNGWVAYVTFPALVVVGGMLLMNLAIAVLWEAFDSANPEQPTRPSLLRESEWRVYQLLGMDWIKYLMVQLSENWEAASNFNPHSLLIPEDAAAKEADECGLSITQKISRYWRSLWRQIGKTFELHFPELAHRLQFLSKEITVFALRLATHRLTSFVMLLVVVVDTLFLLAECGRDTGIWFSIVYLLTSVIFVAEATVLLLAFGKRGLMDGFICLDILTACLALVDGILALALCSGLSGCRAAMLGGDGWLGTAGVVLSMLRPFRIFKLVKYFPSLRMTAEMLLVLHNSLMPYVLLLLYSCAVVAQLGVFLFFDPKYISVHASGTDLTVTRYLNFENPGNAIFLLLAILTGEGWDLLFREFAQVYGEGSNDLSFTSAQLSDFVLSAVFRVTAINSFLYISLLLLNCIVFNLYGAVLIGQFIQTQRALTVKHAAKFIATCRNTGIEMPPEDALQGQSAQALYAVVDMSTDAQRDALIKTILHGTDHGRSAKALGELARKTSLALDICKTVARKSSRMASRASSGSLSWGRHGSRSNSDVIFLQDRSQAKGLINDTDFDRAIAEHGLIHPAEQSAGAASSGTGGKSSSAFKRGKDGGSAIHGRADAFSASLLTDDLPKHRPVETAVKTSVQFAAHNVTVPLAAPPSGSKGCSATSGDSAADDLQFNELCSIFWSAVRDALRQAAIALKAAVAAWVARIAPTDPDCPMLQMAYMGHFVSDAHEGSTQQQLPRPLPQFDKPKGRLPGVSSLSDSRIKSGSSTSITLRQRSNAHAPEQRQMPRQLPSWIQALDVKRREVVAHLHNVCGISGLGWLQLLLQTASFIELVVQCSSKKEVSSWRMYGFMELGFHVALTAELLLLFSIANTSEGIPFFSSRTNCFASVVQGAAWCSLALALCASGGQVDDVMLQTAWFRFAQCTRVLRCIWLLRLWKGTGTHRLALAMRTAGRRILNLGLIFILLVTVFAVDFRYLLEPVAGDSPEVPLAYANLTSLGESFLSVFILTTSEGWPRVLTEFLDLGDRYPVITVLLCLLVVALLSVFVLNLVVGVIVDVLDKEQANLEYSGGVRSATVLRWNEMQRAIFGSNPAGEMTERRGGVLGGEGLGARDWLSHALTSKQLDVAVSVVSVASCLTMTAAGAWAETDLRWRFPSFQTWILWTNAAIVVAYVVEQCLRISVFKKSLFQKGIYVLDLAIAASSLVALIIALATSLHTVFPAEHLWPVAFRMVRVAYVVCHRLPVMRVISITMFNVIPALARVLLLLGGIILFYGLLGTCLFYDAPIDPKLHATFASLFDTIILLMSCCTGENWHDIMLQGRAFYYAKGALVLAWSIVVFSITFIVMAFLLLMNVFMSTVLKGYVDAKRNQSLWKVAQQHQDLLNKWRLREMKLSWLPVHVAVQVLTEIPPPIGFKNLYCEMGSGRMHAILASLAVYPLPVHNNNVHIRDVVLNTTCRACEAHAQRRETLMKLDPLRRERQVELNPRLISGWMSRFSDIAGLTPEFNILQYLAALQIQSFWRTHRLLERKTTTAQLMYMKHLVFLLETSAPICARRASRSDNRRSTLRRKRGTKAGSSFVHRNTALTRVGTFARSPKLNQQPREKLKGVIKQSANTRSQIHQEVERHIVAADQQAPPQASYQDERRCSPQQRQRQKSLRRSTASECIIDVVEGEHTRVTDLNSNLLDEESSAHLLQAKRATPSRQSSTEDLSIISKGANEGGTRSARPHADSALAPAAATAQLSAASSSTMTRFSLAAATEVHYSAAEPPSVLHPAQAVPPRRSSMRAPQPFLAPAPPRRSLRIVPSPARLKQQPSNTLDHADAVEPPRRRGQSVQFTGVERLELQRLLAPALQAQTNSNSSDSEGEIMA